MISGHWRATALFSLTPYWIVNTVRCVTINGKIFRTFSKEHSFLSHLSVPGQLVLARPGWAPPAVVLSGLLCGSVPRRLSLGPTQGGASVQRKRVRRRWGQRRTGNRWGFSEPRLGTSTATMPTFLWPKQVCSWVHRSRKSSLYFCGRKCKVARKRDCEEARIVQFITASSHDWSSTTY